MKPVETGRSDIMIVDDDPVNLKLLEDMLLEKGHEIRSFPRGRLALAAAVKHPPDLILLDVNMPEMNGYEVCKHLKANETLADVPVIFLSGLSETKDKMKAFGSGAVDYVSKPFQFEEVHARVETHLSLHALQRALKTQNQRLEESAADVIFRFELHPQPHFAYINPAATSILGYTPNEHYADPELMLKIVHPDDRDALSAVFRGDFSSGSTVTFRCVHRNKKTIWIEQRNTLVKDSEGRPIAIDGIARDITERRNLEEQLRQSQKMESIGLLAGGVAHDFNNMLTVTIGYCDLILSDDSPPARTVDKVNQVKKAAQHAAALTKQLLAFGRRQILHPTVLNINTVVETSTKMLRRIIGEDIQLVTRLDADLGSVKADATQIDQVLMNLAVNAKDAMPEGGTITIETRNLTLDESRAAEGFTTGPCVMLAFSDTGCGMDAVTKSRIFEPFYTTKELGKGTGLGLSIIYGIVKQSAGDIRVFSEPGRGTRFEIILPRSEPAKETTEAKAPIATVAAGSETILLVEDDEAVRNLVATFLRNGGYSVLMASEGNEALRVWEQFKGKIGLLLTDVIMPGMSGAALVESLKGAHPGIRVLFMSGYAGDAVVSQGQLDPRIPLIQKPFTAEKLLEKVRAVLDSGVSVQTIMKATS